MQCDTTIPLEQALCQITLFVDVVKLKTAFKTLIQNILTTFNSNKHNLHFYVSNSDGDRDVTLWIAALNIVCDGNVLEKKGICYLNCVFWIIQ